MTEDKGRSLEGELILEGFDEEFIEFVLNNIYIDLPREFRTTENVTDCLFGTAWREHEKKPI